MKSITKEIRKAVGAIDQEAEKFDVFVPDGGYLKSVCEECLSLAEQKNPMVTNGVVQMLLGAAMKYPTYVSQPIFDLDAKLENIRMLKNKTKSYYSFILF